MESGIFRFIVRFSLRDQVLLVLMSALALPFLFLTLELPKTIVNEAIGGTDFPRVILGVEFGQIPFLLLLCGLFLLLVIISGVLKYVTATYRYRVGDRLLRRLRYDMIERLLRFPPSDFRNLSSGQVVSMITAETSNLGFFIAEAFAVPAIALGTLGTIVLFMFLQNWTMGVAAIALYPLQIYLIPKIQRQINNLQRQEVQAQRNMSQRIGDVFAGVSEIHGHDTSQYELADFSRRLGDIFNYRVKISAKRYVANILNQFVSQLTPFFFLSVGGYLVIIGEISLGSLVAVLAAYKDMYAPWKDIIDYYQKAEDARVRYDQLRQFFERNNLIDKAMIEDEPGDHSFTGAQLVAANVVVEKEEGHRPVDGASVRLALPAHAVILGSGSSGREEFARLLARLDFPNAGSLLVGDKNLAELPDSVTGRRIGYVGSHTWLGTGTLRQTLTYPLLRRPGKEDVGGEPSPAPVRSKERLEALRAGNSPHDIGADWIDYAAAGCRDATELEQRMIELLKRVDLDEDVYQIGLRQAISPDQRPELAAELIRARGIFHDRLDATGRSDLIEAFDVDKYNSNASVAENILFGTPVGPYFAIGNLGHNDYMRQVIERAGLTEVFLEMGRRLAAIKVEIFHDLPPGHEFFERFSFIGPDQLPEFEAILRRIESAGMGGLGEHDRELLMVLPFKLVEAQDHEGLIDDGMKARLLTARRAFAVDLPPRLRDKVQFFENDSYNAASSVVDNILFGKTASSKAGSSAQIGQLVAEVVDELGLRDAIVSVGLEYWIGTGGARLSAVQRQKVAVARCLIKRPEILVMNEALSSLDNAAQKKVLTNIISEMQGRSLILFEPHEGGIEEFENVLMMEQGRFVPSGTAADGTQLQPSSDSVADKPVDEESSSVGLNEIVTMLRDIPLFSSIDRSKLKLLAFASKRVHFEPGQEVFHQGDPGDRAYVVIKGEVDVVLESETGENTVATLGRNEIFGEMALISRMPRTTTIRARTHVVLLTLSQDVFLRMVEENSEIASAMMRMLAERLASTLRDYSRAMATKAQ